MTTDKIGQQHTLYYAHDPMCSWCWGFKPAWVRLQQALPDNIKIQHILGGLAPDTSEPMPEAMRRALQETWQRIAVTIPGTQFNHDFWTQNTPRRATYPACRAIIAAKAQNDAFEHSMISAIQQAYYLNARNPSDDSVLIDLASEIGCDVSAFKESLNDKITVDSLNQQMSFARSIGAQGFPSLFFEAVGKKPVPLALNYNDNSNLLEQLHNAIAA